MLPMTQKKIAAFFGEYDFLSNFFTREFVYRGQKFQTSEHAYQAEKAKYEDDYERIRTAYSPGAAKKIGQTIALRDDWELVKVDVMRNVVKEKFTQHPDLIARLLATEDAILEEGNYWNDTFWGVCKGKGLNVLGNILMILRKEFAEELIKELNKERNVLFAGTDPGLDCGITKADLEKFDSLGNEIARLRSLFSITV